MNTSERGPPSQSVVLVDDERANFRSYSMSQATNILDARIYIYIYIYTHVHTYMCIYTYIYIYTCICIHTNNHTLMKINKTYNLKKTKSQATSKLSIQ